MNSIGPSRDTNAPELLKQAARDVRELAQLEFALAKEELLRDLHVAGTSAALAAGAVLLAELGAASLIVAAGLAFGVMWALGLAAALLGGASALGFVAYRRLPRTPMSETIRRLEGDEVLLRGHLP